MSWVWGVVAVLVVWAGVTAMRHETDARRQDAKGPVNDDDIDHAALEQAERDIKDVDVFQQPEEGFKGDDWGPGTGGYGPNFG